MNPGRRTARFGAVAHRQRGGLAGRLTHATRRLLAGAALTLLAACGGGTSQIEPFEPVQMIVFGDEASLIRDDGLRYTVNPRNSTTGTVDCTSQPIWVQAVAKRLGFVFAGCDAADATGTKAQMRAAAGATVDDLKLQIDQQAEGPGFAAKSLATVLAGGNDILALYAQYPQRSEDDLIADARQRGERLALQVNRLVDLGPRVLLVTVPDLGLSPYALAQKAAYTDTDRAALISRLVSAFNSRVRTTILNDGRYIGLVLGDEAVQAMVRLPVVYGLKDATTAVCTVALPQCTDQTLVEGGSSASWLWAGDRQLAYGGQVQLGNLAVTRVIGNPF